MTRKPKPIRTIAFTANSASRRALRSVYTGLFFFRPARHLATLHPGEVLRPSIFLPEKLSGVFLSALSLLASQPAPSILADQWSLPADWSSPAPPWTTSSVHLTQKTERNFGNLHFPQAVKPHLWPTHSKASNML